MGMIDVLKIIIIIQMFYAVSTTMIAYALPEDSKPAVYSFTEVGDSINTQNISSTLQSNMDKQTGLSIVDVGSLIFYSGNYLLDLLLNFIFALPQMLGLIIAGLGLLLPGIDSYLKLQVEAFASAVLIALYVIGLIQMLMNVRSQSQIT